MALEEDFEINRDPIEHENNELHQLCELYKHYLENGVPPEDAKKYVRWTYKNLVKEK